jgi:hypothetical protein
LTSQEVKEQVCDNTGNNRVIHWSLVLPFETFRIFGFIDNKDMRTTRPGVQARQEQNLEVDIQRAFYSGYFSSQGLKVKAVFLQNGMVGSVFVAGLQNLDSGILNLSGIN